MWVKVNHFFLQCMDNENCSLRQYLLLLTGCAGMLGGIGCDASGQSCTYTASYAVQQDDSITFTVSATTTGWVALGVSDDQLMVSCLRLDESGH